MGKEDTAETTRSATEQLRSVPPKSRLHTPVLSVSQRIEIVAHEIAEAIPVRRRAG